MKKIQFVKSSCFNLNVQIFSCEAMNGRTGRWHYFVHKVTCSMIQRGWMKPVFTSLWRRNKKDSSWFPHIMYAITKSKIVPPIYCCLVQFAMLIYYRKSIESLRARWWLLAPTNLVIYWTGHSWLILEWIPPK